MYIGPSTFTSGFILVLHKACCSDTLVNVVQYIFEHHMGQFNINELNMPTLVTYQTKIIIIVIKLVF